MSYCLAEYLRVIAPYLSYELVCAAALSKIQLLAQKLQPTWGALIECALGPDSSKVDFSVHLSDNVIDLSEEMLIHPVWQRIRQLSIDCANPTSYLSQEAASIWLEFEIDEEPLEIPVPGVFVSLQEGYLQQLSGDAATFQRWLTEMVLERLLGHPIPLKQQQSLDNCQKALPIGAQVLCMGVMLARQPGTIRLKVSGIPPLHVPEYLEQIGWPGPLTELEALATRLQSLVDRIVLNLDISLTVDARVGLECFIDRRLDKSSQWQPLLNYLVESKLCTQKKYDALLSWPGFCYEQSCAVPWPRNLRTVSKFLGPRASSVLVRELNHIQLTLQPGNLLEANGYLWFGSDWLGPKCL